MENLNRIKGALADAGKMGVWFAGQLGKDSVTVSKWCTNTTQHDLQTLAKISELLNIDIRELIVKRKVNIQYDL
mgnify:CR=1 FL=1